MSFIDTHLKRGFDAAKMQKVNLFETPDIFCDLYCLLPGQSQKLHHHEGATKFYYVVEGEGTFQIADRTQSLSVGGLAFAEPGTPHGVANQAKHPLILLVAMAPNPNP